MIWTLYLFSQPTGGGGEVYSSLVSLDRVGYSPTINRRPSTLRLHPPVKDPAAEDDEAKVVMVQPDTATAAYATSDSALWWSHRFQRSLASVCFCFSDIRCTALVLWRHHGSKHSLAEGYSWASVIISGIVVCGACACHLVFSSACLVTCRLFVCMHTHMLLHVCVCVHLHVSGACFHWLNFDF